MLKEHYYYLVAGLEDLAFDTGKGYTEMAEFREELKNNLHPSDYQLISLLFLPYDNNNLIAFSEGKTDVWDPFGSYSESDFEEQKRINNSILREKNVLPDYMVELLAELGDNEEVIDRISAWKNLAEGYIRLVLNSGNRFLEEWIRFDRDLNNILALINSKDLNLDANRYIIGDDPFAKELIELFNSGKDFAIPVEPEYAPMIFRITVENEFLERERKIDLARWNFIDSMTFFEYFTIDLILGYLIKLLIVLRWKRLDPETGRMMLQKFIGEMEAHVVAGDFNIEY